jgi:hypothetical protein
MSTETLEDNTNVEKKSENHARKISELQEDLHEIAEDIESGEINPKLKLPEEGEEVAEFIDSKGQERKASREIALLGPEQIVAIDSFFREHDELADSVETMLSFAQDINTELKNVGPDGKYQPLSRITDPEKVLEHIKSPEPLEPNSEQVQLPEDDRKKLTDLTAQIAELKSLLAIAPLGDDYKSIKEYIDSYYQTLGPDEMPQIAKLGMMARINSGARESSLQEIEAFRAEQQRMLDLQIDLANKLISKITQGQLDAKLASFPSALFEPYSTGSGYDPGEGLDPTNGPLQNEVCIIEEAQELANYYQQFEYMHVLEDDTLSVLKAPEIRAVLDQLSPQEQSQLSTLIATSIQKDLESNHELKLGQITKAAYDAKLKVTDTAKDADFLLRNALYQEKALADLYISEREEERIAGLLETIKLIYPESTADPQKIIDSIKEPDFKIVSASSLLVHNSGFAREIVESGELRTKQTQINKTGTLNETTKPGTETQSGLKTHSRSIHYSDKLHLGYSSVERVAPGEAGVILVPIGKIVEHSPINKDGMQLTSVKASGNETGTINLPNNQPDENGKWGDEVFFSSPIEEESDIFEVTLDSTTAAIIVGGEMGERQTEAGATIYNVEPQYDKDKQIDLGATMVKSGLISGQIIPKISSDPKIAGRIVVPLRRAPLDFVPEIVDNIGQNTVTRNRFRKDTQVSTLDTNGGVERTHVRD